MLPNRTLPQRFIDWLCKVTGYIPDEAKRSIQGYRLLVEQNETDLKILADHYEDLIGRVKAENDQMKRLISDNQVYTIDTIRIENNALKASQDALTAEMNSNLEYYKAIETRLSEGLHNSSIFGFPNSQTFPGVTTITDCQTDTDYIQTGRTILTDDVYDKVMNAPTLSEKYDIVYNQLIKYGIVTRIINQVAKNNGLQLTLTFNDNCKAFEVYYTAVYKKMPGYLELEFHKPKDE